MYSRVMVVVAVLVAFGLMVPTVSAKSQTGFLDRTVITGKENYRYQVFVPQDWTKARKWPVILFLHGAGERGNDGLQQTQVGIGAAIRWTRDRFPAIVVMPQCRKDARWTDPSMMEMALKALDQSMKEFKGDPQRVYLTGLSMGGYGTWGVAAKHPGRFAAYVPICGGIRLPRQLQTTPTPEGGADPYAEVARIVGKTPVWIFHGDADPTVPVAESRKMNEALKAAGGDVRYTEYPGIGHNSWDKAYAEEQLLKWLLSQHK